MDVTQSAQKYLHQAGQQLKLGAARLVDQHINLAVTGLSQSGKTAFITSLINQLLEVNQDAVLPFFSSKREERIIGVKRQSQSDVTAVRFAYEDAINGFQHNPAQWPPSTTGISQVRLVIRYKKKHGLSRWLAEDGQLTVDITDFPGEWLLDLPLLNMPYQRWCEFSDEQLLSATRAELYAPVAKQIEQLDLKAPADERLLQQIADSYASYLQQCRLAGYQLLVPGRFLLPGELAGAPVLHFFPLTQAQCARQQLDLANLPKGSNAELLATRFEQYKQQVVQPFYQQHFKRFDRQIILVDCLAALNQGWDRFQELQLAMNWLMQSFAYGSSNILHRLFKPKIDKILFAASKADHISADQQLNLVRLLDSMLRQARQQLQFDGVTSESTAIAAIRASTSGVSYVNGEAVQVVQGTTEDGERLTLFPGEVPGSCPRPELWQQHQFEFPRFAPPSLTDKHALPHIRMDLVIDFMLADKLR